MDAKPPKPDDDDGDEDDDVPDEGDRDAEGNTPEIFSSPTDLEQECPFALSVHRAEPAAPSPEAVPWTPAGAGPVTPKRAAKGPGVDLALERRLHDRLPTSSLPGHL